MTRLEHIRKRLEILRSIDIIDEKAIRDVEKLCDVARAAHEVAKLSHGPRGYECFYEDLRKALKELEEI